jgi:protein ImuB
VLAAVDAAAGAAGLVPGMPLAQARAMVPGLTVCDADPGGDAAALRRLAGWCLRYAPLASADAPDGVWIDVTGTAHLFGGERRLLHDLLGRLAAQGLVARAAIATTPGTAWAMARFGVAPLPAASVDHPWGGGGQCPRPAAPAGTAIIAAGAEAAALASLPVEALRLSPSISDRLRLLGFACISDLTAVPRAPLVRRFGALLATRLDQAHGTVFEPIVPVVPPAAIQARRAFPEPLLTAPSLSAVITGLVHDVCGSLERAGQGARRLDLLFERVDGAVPALRVGTARASRDPRHLARMLDERLDRIDPGLGIEAMRLVVALAGPLSQVPAPLLGQAAAERDLAPLVDRLANRLGAERVHRAEPVESDVPERAVRRVPPLAPNRMGGWPTEWPRPVRLLDPPQPIEAMALLPDHPPVAFTWRRVRHRVRHADGPERIAGEWWKRDGEMRSVRDYFRVEDEEGRRFWLFRRGDGADPETGDRRWFLHGFF